MRIIAFGDIHMDTKQARKIPEIKTADCVVITGDLTLCGGRREAQEVLEPLSELHPRLYAMIGNMDLPEIDDLLTETGINLNGTGTIFDNIGLLGLGGSNTTPFGTPSEFSEEDLSRTLWQAYETVKSAPIKLLFSHPPPINTKLDVVTGGVHVGSQAVRAFIEQTDCRACVCGHIHEAMGVDRIGETTLVNPGLLSQGGYADIECDGGEVKVSLKHC